MLRTMERFNLACDALAAVAFSNRCANKVELQKLAHHDIRRDFGLGAHRMTVRAIAKVVEVYKRDKDIQPKFRPHGAIVYDQRVLSWKGADGVSILTNDGRQIMPWICGAYQQAMLERARGQADLIYRDGMFFLYVTIDVGDVPEGDPTEYLGVDLGRRNIAADSDGETFCGAHNANLRKRHARLRRNLQRKGTKSAKRRLKARRLKEARFCFRYQPQDQQDNRSEGHRHRSRNCRRRPDAHPRPDNGSEVSAPGAPQLGIRSASILSDLQSSTGWHPAGRGEPKIHFAGVSHLRLWPTGRTDSSRDHFQCISCGHAGPSDTTAARNISVLGSRHAAERRAA